MVKKEMSASIYPAFRTFCTAGERNIVDVYSRTNPKLWKQAYKYRNHTYSKLPYEAVTAEGQFCFPSRAISVRRILYCVKLHIYLNILHKFYNIQSSQFITPRSLQI